MSSTNKRDAKTMRAFESYWRSYGGWRAIVTSPYFLVALLLTLLLFPAWLNAKWWGIVIQILPNIVGFSIGGFAIWLGFGDEKFKALIAERDSESDVSPYMEVSATFTHFVIVQIAAILAAVAGGALFDKENPSSLAATLPTFSQNGEAALSVMQAVFGFCGFLLFLYAIATAVAAVFAIFEVASWFDKYKAISIGVPGQRVVQPAVPHVGSETSAPALDASQASAIQAGPDVGKTPAQH